MPVIRTLDYGMINGDKIYVNQPPRRQNFFVAIAPLCMGKLWKERNVIFRQTSKTTRRLKLSAEELRLLDKAKISFALVNTPY